MTNYEPSQDQPDVDQTINSGRDTRIGNDFVGRDKAEIVTIYNNINQTVLAWGHYDVPWLDSIIPVDQEGDRAFVGQGIRLSDGLGVHGQVPPSLYLTFFRSKQPLYPSSQLPRVGPWLFVQADMRPALNVRLQVNMSRNESVTRLLQFLENGAEDCELGESYVDVGVSSPTDLVYLWRERNEMRFMMSTFTETRAGLSVHARIAPAAATALSQFVRARFEPALEQRK